MGWTADSRYGAGAGAGSEGSLKRQRLPRARSQSWKVSFRAQAQRAMTLPPSNSRKSSIHLFEFHLDDGFVIYYPTWLVASRPLILLSLELIMHSTSHRPFLVKRNDGFLDKPSLGSRL